jgi:hypothetical protein
MRAKVVSNTDVGTGLRAPLRSRGQYTFTVIDPALGPKREANKIVTQGSFAVETGLIPDLEPGSTKPISRTVLNPKNLYQKSVLKGRINPLNACLSQIPWNWRSGQTHGKYIRKSKNGKCRERYI